MSTSKELQNYFTNADRKRLGMTDKPKRNRENETYLYVSPDHKAKLKAYAEKTKRTMRAEAELWIDGLKV